MSGTVAQRIDGLPTQIQLVVQVRPCRAAGVARVGDDLSLRTCSPSCTNSSSLWQYMVVTPRPWSRTRMRPLTPSLEARRTTPAAVARTGVPTAVPRSTPACSRRTPSTGFSRIPKGEVIRIDSGSGQASAYAPACASACEACAMQSAERGGSARARSSSRGGSFSPCARVSA